MKHKHKKQLIVLLLLLFPAYLLATKSRNTSELENSTALKCIACHGLDGNSKNIQWPNLAGLNKDYIAKQIKDFKTGDRSNPEMDVSIKLLSNEAEIQAVAQYFSRQRTKSLQKTTKFKTQSTLVDIALGKEIFTGKRLEYGIPACASCHGKQGEGDIDKKRAIISPRLTSQHSAYLVNQMKLFRTFKRKNDKPAMMRNVSMMMDDEDIESVVAYIMTLNNN